MAKIRIHELRKIILEKFNINIENKTLIQKLSEFGIEAKSHASTIEENNAKIIIDHYNEIKNKQSPNKEVTKPQNKEQSKDKNQKETQKVQSNTTKNEQNNSQKIEIQSVQKKNKNKKNNKNNKYENNKYELSENIEDDIKIIQIPEKITVKELAQKLNKNSSEIVLNLMKKGIMATINQQIEFETASNLAEEYDVIAEKLQEEDILEKAFKEEEDKEKDLEERPPVVVVMGHVDHGKTSLLDAIRQSKVTQKEAGGITQHIGAYTVEINNKIITFLDTPGHEAFTAMRMRGAKVTDIAILVVAADDGVMPQTIEAINHAKAAGVEIIVAINKIDKENANVDRVKQELTEHNILVEDWGGDTICVPVSAHTKEGLDNLLEMVLLVAEMKELKANPKKLARGIVIEAKLDKGRGAVATVLVQSGTLKVGDPIVIGPVYGKIRAMMNDKGQKIRTALPSIPVEILGLSDVPLAGETFYIAKSDKFARQMAESVIAKGREAMIKETPQKVSLDDLFSQIQEGNFKELNIIIKGDVQGSIEALKSSLEKISSENVRIKIIHSAVGAITESDVMLASTSNAIIIGFNVRPENLAQSMADEQKVDVRLYRVIYNVIEDIQASLKGLLDPIYEEKIIGHAEIRQLFKASGVGTIGGSYITDGKITRNSQVRIIRDGKVIYEGELGALKRFKDDVKEVNSGYECGISFNKFNDIKEGDKVEAFIMQEISK